MNYDIDLIYFSSVPFFSTYLWSIYLFCLVNDMKKIIGINFTWVVS